MGAAKAFRGGRKRLWIKVWIVGAHDVRRRFFHPQESPSEGAFRVAAKATGFNHFNGNRRFGRGNRCEAEAESEGGERSRSGSPVAGIGGRPLAEGQAPFDEGSVPVPRSASDGESGSTPDGKYDLRWEGPDAGMAVSQERPSRERRSERHSRCVHDPVCRVIPGGPILEALRFRSDGRAGRFGAGHKVEPFRMGQRPLGAVPSPERAHLSLGTRRADRRRTVPRSCCCGAAMLRRRQARRAVMADRRTRDRKGFGPAIGARLTPHLLRGRGRARNRISRLSPAGSPKCRPQGPDTPRRRARANGVVSGSGRA